MKKRVAVLAAEDDLSVDLTLHDFSATLLIRPICKCPIQRIDLSLLNGNI